MSAVLLVMCLLACSGESRTKASFSSSSGSKEFPHDITTKSGLTNLYNQQVTQVEHVTRPMAGVPFNHHGSVVTTASGDRYLVHKGDGYGKSGGQTVVTDARHMSDQWKTTETRSVEGHTVSDFVKAGGPNYHLLTDNCIHGAKRMTRLGNH